MLKKIEVQDVRLGMHLHAMCGAWLDHPFWRTKFILRDPADLEKLRASSVKVALTAAMTAVAAVLRFVGLNSELWYDEIKTLIESVRLLPVALQRRVLQKQLEREGVAPEFEWIESLRAAAGKVISISRDVSVCRDVSGRVLVRRSEVNARSTAEVRLSFSAEKGQGTFAGLSWNWTRWPATSGGLPKFVTGTEWFDADRIGREVVLRHWRAGDRFQPIGMTSSQKLQDLFTNLKVPRAERVQRVVATTADGEIWWVEGLRIGELFKLQPATRRRLQWSWQRRHSNCGVQ